MLMKALTGGDEVEEFEEEAAAALKGEAVLVVAGTLEMTVV